ncbi:MAG: UDP-N-acetylmuramate--L-alanine ligase, partial [Actinomycetota bacterium]|nr:UDP-N-acetylmuramate--L-alanine ligase [Actinomycetota bacterium]
MTAEHTPPSLDTPRRIHVVAAGGAGMSGIATVLAQQGHEVTGSDQVDGPAAERLRELGVEVHVGHHEDHVGDAELVVISTAVSAGNPEVVAARRRGIDVLGRIDLLPALARRQPFVSVSGTHGKTTTTSMLATAMVGAGADPSYLIGAPVPVLGGAAAHGGGRWFVLEADESDGSFLAGPRAAAVVTNIEADHLEYWGGWDELVAGFERFLAETDGPTAVCADDPVAAEVGRRVGAATYGQAADATHRIEDLSLGSEGASFTFVTPSGSVPVSVSVPGVHNALNAAGALTLAELLGLDLTAAAGALGRYTGVARRFERRGRRGGVDFVDDYAHLPTEVRAALSAGRSGGWDRVVATFQPHRYSRTQALWNEFADAFVDADVLVLTDVYAAGEAPRPGVSGALLVEAVTAAHPESDVRWAPTLDDAADLLAAELRAGDLCMSIGAGDVTDLADLVLARMPLAPDLSALDEALGFLGPRLLADHPLGPLSTYRVGGRAARFVEVADAGELAVIAAALASLAAPVPTLVVGRGSNLLVADAGFPGLAVVLGEGFTHIEIGGGGDPSVVRAGGATSLPVLARRTAAMGLRGLEWAV